MPYQQSYYLERREEIKARTKAWKLANPERVKASLQRTAARRTRFLAAVKETCGCVDCGARDGLLHFDHRPGTVKLFSPATGVRHSWRRLVDELEKCDVRCGSCHRKRHWRDVPAAERKRIMARVRAAREHERTVPA